MASLLLGAFELLATDGSARVMASGTSWGAPVPIEVAVNSFLQDGAIVVTQGHDNREVNVQVRFYGTDLAALNAKEAALFLELERPNTLTWTPGGTAPASVFVVVTSSLAQADESFVGEVQDDPWRTYNIRLLCEAFTRSVAETTTAALPATGTTTTLVNDGSATTNWTGAINGVTTSPSVVSGAVKVTTGSAGLATTCTLTLTTAITTSATKYLQIDWKPESAAGNPDLRAYGDGVEIAKLADTVSPTSGLTRTWFGPVSASSIAVLRLDSYSLVPVTPPAGPNRSLYVDNINRTDIVPSLGTGRQLLRSITVGGSARAPGSIAIEHASSALGDVLAYFWPDTSDARAYSPSLRQYRVSGAGSTTDSTMVSGAREIIATGGAPWVADVPVSKLATGQHLIVLRGASSSATSQTFSWSAQLRINGVDVGPASTGAPTRTTPTTGYLIHTLGSVILPTVDVPLGSTAVMRITLGAQTVPSFSMDEAWLFNTAIGRLVGPVTCGTAAPSSGGTANRLWIEPPTTTTLRPTVRIGFASDRSDSFFPSGTALGGWQFPEFNPPRVNVLTITTNALDSSTTFRSFNRYHTNAAS